jgi:hypothetical protein
MSKEGEGEEMGNDRCEQGWGDWEGGCICVRERVRVRDERGRKGCKRERKEKTTRAEADFVLNVFLQIWKMNEGLAPSFCHAYFAIHAMRPKIVLPSPIPSHLSLKY